MLNVIQKEVMLNVIQKEVMLNVIQKEVMLLDRYVDFNYWVFILCLNAVCINLINKQMIFSLYLNCTFNTTMSK